MNSNLSFEKASSFINMTIYDICLHHNKRFIYYCKSCSSELCQICIKSHFNHDIINYDEIQPKKEEIEILKNAIKKYEEDYNNFLSQIFSWKKLLDKIIIFFENQIKKNINFILNIYIIKNNNNIIDNLFYNNENQIGLFDYNNYFKMKMSLDEIIKNINNTTDNFLINSNYILKILWENYNINKKDDIHSINKNNKILEKYIDLSIHKNINMNKNKNLFNKSEKNINLKNTHQLFNPKKIGNIFLDKNNFNNLNITNIINSNSSPIYFKKRSNSNTDLLWNKNKKNISFNINEFSNNSKK